MFAGGKCELNFIKYTYLLDFLSSFGINKLRDIVNIHGTVLTYIIPPSLTYRAALHGCIDFTQTVHLLNNKKIFVKTTTNFEAITGTWAIKAQPY